VNNREERDLSVELYSDTKKTQRVKSRETFQRKDHFSSKQGCRRTRARKLKRDTFSKREKYRKSTRVRKAKDKEKQSPNLRGPSREKSYERPQGGNKELQKKGPRKERKSRKKLSFAVDSRLNESKSNSKNIQSREDKHQGEKEPNTKKKKRGKKGRGKRIEKKEFT